MSKVQTLIKCKNCGDDFSAANPRRRKFCVRCATQLRRKVNKKLLAADTVDRERMR